VLKGMGGAHLRLVVGRKREDEEDWGD
jgi:hypothetical protein